MRIALIADGIRVHPHDSVGGWPGCGGHVLGVARTIARRGHDVRVYTSSVPTATVADTHGLVGIAPPPAARTDPDDVPGSSRAFGSWLADEWSRGWCPDIVHGHFYTNGLAGLLAARTVGIPFVQTFHQFDRAASRDPGARSVRIESTAADPANPLGPGNRRGYERLLGVQADAVVATWADEIADLVGLRVPRRAIMVVPEPVDTALYRPAQQSRSFIRPGHDAVASGPVKVVSIGPLDGGYGHADVVRALPLAPGADLLIIGGRPKAKLPTDSGADALMRLAERCGVAGRVELAGALADADVVRAFQQADLLVSAPARGVPCTSILEAMACGLPVIAYARRHIGDLVVDGITGDIVRPMDVQALGVALRRLVNQPFRRVQYATAAVDRIGRMFTLSRAAEMMLDAYGRAADAYDAQHGPEAVAPRSPASPITPGVAG
jgi:D-inositol-3-phosphate glycosyltransferase